jgi:hypothetical protein
MVVTELVREFHCQPADCEQESKVLRKEVCNDAEHSECVSCSSWGKIGTRQADIFTVEPLFRQQTPSFCMQGAWRAREDGSLLLVRGTE